MTDWSPVDYIEIPFVSGGRTREGCDCWGLVRLVYAEHFGKELPSLETEYRDALNPRETAGALVAGILVVDAYPVAVPFSGDIAVIRYRGVPCHVGIVTPDLRIMHTDDVIGVTVSTPDGSRLRGRIEGYYRVR